MPLPRRPRNSNPKPCGSKWLGRAGAAVGSARCAGGVCPGVRTPPPQRRCRLASPAATRPSPTGTRAVQQQRMCAEPAAALHPRRAAPLADAYGAGHAPTHRPASPHPGFCRCDRVPPCAGRPTPLHTIPSMSTDGPSIPSHAVPFENDAAPPPSPGQVPAPTPTPAAPGWTWLGLLIGTLGRGTAALLWNKVNGMQELLAQQTTQAQAQSTEARTIAKEAQDQSLAANTRLTVREARLAEVSLQRGQLEELVGNLSRSQDDTLALDLEAAMRLAVQQAQLTGSTEPLMASLRSASKRIEKSAQP